MGFLGGIGLAAVGGIADAIGGRKEAKRARRDVEERERRQLGFLSDSEAGFEEAFGFAEQGFANALEDARLTRSRSLRFADDMLRQEVQRIFEERDAAQAASDQDLVSRGLFGSTVATNQQSQIGFLANRAASDASARFVQDRVARDAALSSSVQGLMVAGGQNRVDQASQIAAINANRANVVGGTPIVQVPSGLSTAGQIAGIAGNALGQASAAGQRDKVLDGFSTFLGGLGGIFG